MEVGGFRILCYNFLMTSTEGEAIEVIPGVMDLFSKVGISVDAFNVWNPNSMRATNGRFAELEPTQHYGEYFQDQDKLYSAKGKLGLFDAIMQRSNPEAVAAFDRLVDEFNADLPRIKEQGDNKTVQTFLRRAHELQEKLPDTKAT